MTEKANNSVITITRLMMGYPPAGGEPGFVRRNITFSADKGELVALIGPNGSGKSTLLRTMAGFIPPLAGELLWQGKAIGTFSARALARMISFVSTENISVPNMRVADLVAYGRFPYTGWLGRLQTSDREVVADALRKTGLSDFSRREVVTLSDGERQRALIARALAQDTPFILLDEPTAFLDISGKYEIFQLLRQLASEDAKTILLSTHDLGIALREADRLWMLTASEEYEGAPEDAVLQGWLNHLFSNPLVGFDHSSGEFFFRKETAGTAMVSGSGEARDWTCRALRRAGFAISAEETADLTITVTNDEYPGGNRWVMTRENRTREFETLHALISQLKKKP